MHFSKPGWLDKYLKLRTREPFPGQLPSHGVRVLEGSGVHHELEESVYYFLQPTGLLYGFPLGPPFPEIEYPDAQYHNASDRAHIIFLDALFGCLVAERHYLLEGLQEEADHLASAAEMALGFFGPETGASQGRLARFAPALLGWMQPSARVRFEKSVSLRLGEGRELLSLPGQHYNSLLFLDLHFCLNWQRRMLTEPEAAEAHRAELQTQQATFQEALLRLMISAASSDGPAGNDERRLVDWFLKSSRLPAVRQRALVRHLEEGLPLEQIELPAMPWLVRRFMLEAVLMVVMIDRNISANEERMLNAVVEKLELWSEELSQSLSALEIFLVNHGQTLGVLRRRSAMQSARDSLSERAGILIRKNMARLVKEIRETQELYQLLLKATKEDLDAAEKAKVRAQLLDIMKTIPALAIFALPGGGLVLPILIKLLPFNVLPSAFDD